MKKSRYTDSQIMAILKQAEAGTPVPELCREHGMSSATFYKWRAKYGGMDASLMARFKELEEENRRLKSVSRQRSSKRLYKKSGKAVSAQGDGATGSCHIENQYQTCMHSVWYQRNLLSLPAKV